MEPVGVMLVGLNGATANTLVTGYTSNDGDWSGDASLGSVIEGHPLLATALQPFRDLVFGGWDVDGRSAHDAALAHGILPETAIERAELGIKELQPLHGVTTPLDTAEALESPYQRRTKTYRDAVELVKSDIEAFRKEHGIRTCVVGYLGPPLRTFAHAGDLNAGAAVLDLVERSDEALPSGLIYALGAIEAGAPFFDFTPNVALALGGVQELATSHGVPIAGRDGNTGQTLLKTVIGNMFRVRNLEVEGWYSTNILGNNDGLVLSRPEHRELKMEDKMGVLEPILGYGVEHAVDITYYKPRGDNKESWDSIDFKGWLGLGMMVKINWLGRDSVLAAPLVLDLIRHLAHADVNGGAGLQEHLAMYFKHPLGCGVISLTEAYERLLRHYS